MNEVLPLTTIGIIILVAIVLSIFAKKIGQNAVLGFIITGFLLGPFWLNFLHPKDPLVVGFAEMGLFVLLFYLGLELSLKDFLKSGSTAFGLAILDMIGLAGSGALIMMALGFSPLMSAIVGIMLFSASTAISAKFAIDKGIIREPSTKISLAILILQDFLGILLLVFILSLTATQGSAISLAFTALMFATATFAVIQRLSKHVEKWMEENKYGQTEVTLYALGIGLVVATLGSFLGLNSALGAYFAGFALAETKAGEKIKKDVGFMRDFFLMFFFVAFGTTLFYNMDLNILQLPNAQQLLFYIGVGILLIATCIIAIHGIIFSVIGGAFGLSKNDSAISAVLLTPLGEFVVIIATSAGKVLKGTEAVAIAPIAFLLILITVGIFQPLYNILPFYQKISKKLPAFFSKKETETQVKELTPQTTKLVQKIAGNFLIILSITWIAFLLYENLPNFGVPIPYSREVTVSVLWFLATVWPGIRIVKAFKKLIDCTKPVLVKEKWPKKIIQEN
ncbi:MAG: cation:proton antiporter [Candidatus Diapherotrites archaeon]|nr:cation:proton antiporter [Candidatus Diapherotrites archaeon]